MTEEKISEVNDPLAEWGDSVSIMEPPTESPKDKEPEEESAKRKEEPEEDLFSDFEDKEEESEVEEVEEEPEKEVEEKEKPPEELALKVDLMKKAGLISEDAEITSEDDLLDEVDASINERAEERVKEELGRLKDKFDGEELELIQFLFNGGTVQEYTQANSQRAASTFNLATEEGMKDFATYWLMNVERKSKEETEDEIDYLEERDKLKNFTQTRFSKYKDAEQKQREKIFEEAERREETKAQQVKAYKAKVESTLGDTKGYGDFKISERDKRALKRYFFTKNVDVNGKMLTEFDRDFIDMRTNSLEKLIVLGHLMKNDFKIPDLLKKAETNLAKKTEKKLQRATDKPKKTKAPSSDKPVWEYF